jgi:hypothetical protein
MVYDNKVSFSKKIYRLVTFHYSIQFLGRYLIQNQFWDLKSILWLRNARIRKILKSDLVLTSKKMVIPKSDCLNKLVLICMTRDEEALLHQWLSHHAKIKEVCAIVIIDHISLVPLNEIIFQEVPHKNSYLYRFQNVNYFQAHVLNYIVGELSAEYPESIFLPLDTDEFLPSSVAQSIVECKEGIGYLNWRMVWPAQLLEPNVIPKNQILIDKYCCLKNDFLGNKHFMRGEHLKKSYKWSQGAHQVFNRFGQPKEAKRIGHLIHIPVRSIDQLSSKFSSRKQSHVDKALNHDNGTLGSHWNIDQKLISSPEVLARHSIQKYLPPGVDLADQRTLGWDELFSE